MSKKKFFNKYFVIEVSLLLLFLFFLISIPSFINDDSSTSNHRIINNNVESTGIYEETKFKVITQSILSDIDNIKVEDTTNNYIINLLLNDEINNRENTIAQEIVSLYLKNDTQISSELSRNYIEEALDNYDEKKDRVWRNHVLILIDNNNNKTITLYNENIMLRSIYDAKSIVL